ncbi:alginate export family protein [Chitinophaga tropicalis]|uniref:alginate export family protein n=1 Tax=Chitinophaga tropicalis TaxID=2683588 RepID=UPI00293C0D85|nr:alginate export family protein [Chitinophaga tropicalis]
MLRFIFTICVGLIAVRANAQSFKLLRYDENYAGLKDSVLHGYNRIKFIPLSAGKQVYLSFGGGARVEYVSFQNEDWGETDIGHNDFFLQRYDLHGDLHIGRGLRLFVQLRSALENGRKEGPGPTDEDKLNIQNLFIDVSIWQHRNSSLKLRAGRQEIDYGSGRLISVREVPNARLYFTGLKIMYTHRNLSVDGFALMADTTYTGVFDNEPTKEINLWGIYSRMPVAEAGNLELYYLGIHRDRSVFEEGAERENRHTIGSRLWKSGGGFIYNLEAAYQAGSYGRGSINAWTASADVGYSFIHSKLKPAINVRNDYISGDKHAGDGKLQTFNPLYPRGGYFGFNSQIGPANLIDLHPYGTLQLARKFLFQAEAVFHWRYSLNDGIYRPGGNFNMAGASSGKRYIGTAYLVSGVWKVNRFLTLNTGIQYFKPGAFIKDLIPGAKDGLFINSRLDCRF